MSKIKNFLKTNRLFWRYRHLIDSDVWQSYADDGNNPRREFYSNFIQKHSLQTVFEFGCASGPNLMVIRQNCSQSVKFFGYDINKGAVNLAQSKLGDVNSVFKSTLKISDIETALLNWSTETFHLAIYDRVLYLLSDKEVSSHFSKFGSYLKYVILDDFHNSTSVKTNGAYFTKNYIEILHNNGFDLVSEDVSDHVKQDTFFKENAKRLVFIKRTCNEVK